MCPEPGVLCAQEEKNGITNHSRVRFSLESLPLDESPTVESARKVAKVRWLAARSSVLNEKEF